MNLEVFNPNGVATGVESNTVEVRRLVSLVNPYRTRVKQVELSLDELAQSEFGPLLKPEIIWTTGNRDTDEENLKKNLREGDVLLIGGGDGTGNVAASALISDELYGLNIPMFYLWGGNGADNARMTNGKLSKLSPSEVLRTCRLVPINPISTTVSHFAEYTDIAVAYIGFGNIAYLNHKLDHPGHRKKFTQKYAATRLMSEALVIAKHFPDLEEFKIEDSEGERTMLELIVANGSRIAKFGRFQLSLSEPALFKTEAGVNVLEVAEFLIRLAAAKSIGDYIKNGDEYRFKLLSPTLMHNDGEADYLPKDTEVSIKRHERAVLVLSTLL